jgi:hypothetical protein
VRVISFAPRRAVVAKGIRSVNSGRGTTAGTPAAGLCSSSWTFCETVTARRAALRCQRSLPVAMHV